MARLRTSKLQQLGGAAGLGVYFLFAMWRADGISVEDTSEGSFFGVLLGAAISFVIGWFALPALANRIGPQAARRRSEQNRKRRDRERRSGRDRRGNERRSAEPPAPPAAGVPPPAPPPGPGAPP
jgi:uncharacterized membrane protein YccC